MKRALLIGLNYDNSPYSLQFCKADVLAVGKRMEQCKVRTEYIYEDVGIQDLLDTLDFYKNLQKKTDTFYFVYSGHGTQIPGNINEEDGYDEAICLWKNGYIDLFRDDRLRSKLDEFKGQVVVIFDSCFSGGMWRDVFGPIGTKKYLKYEVIEPNINAISEHGNPTPTSLTVDPNKPKINFMFASKENEVSWESNGHGFFTGSFLKHWDKGIKYIKKIMPLIQKDVQEDQSPVHITVNSSGTKILF